MHNKIKNSLLEDLKEKCYSKSNKFGVSSWTHHMLPVVEYAKQMALVLEADMEVVELAAILHDYASVKDYALYEDHHLHGADEAERLLKPFDYPADKLELIKSCIREHRGSVVVKRQSKESICVASADAMSHIANVPSLLHLSYVQRGLSVDEGADWVLKKINRSFNKLSPEAKDIIQDKYDSAVMILRNDHN